MDKIETIKYITTYQKLSCNLIDTFLYFQLRHLRFKTPLHELWNYQIDIHIRRKSKGKSLAKNFVVV